MSSIIDLIYSRYIRKYSTLLVILLLSVLFIYVGYYGYKKYFKDPKKMKEFTNTANANTRKKQAEVMFFFADWCPHCKKAKPEWLQFKEEYDQKEVNDYIISCVEVDCTSDSDPTTAKLIAQYKIESYPTIIMLIGDNRIDYDAKVTKNGLEQLVISGTA